MEPSKSFIRCKKCGYKRWFHKDYGIRESQCPGCRGMYAVVNDDDGYVPNVVQRSTRLGGTLFTLGLVGYVMYCLATGTIYIPAKRGAWEFHGWAMLPASLALLSIGAKTLTYLIDHYDKRNNEYVYESIRDWSEFWFVVLLGVAAATQVYFMARDA